MGTIKKEMEKYLKSRKFCVLCTCSGDDLRATPVTYAVGDDLQIEIYSENYSRKFDLLEKNKKVSLALHNDRAPYKGLQLWGNAEIITPNDPRHFEHLPNTAKKSEKMRELCKALNLILVTPVKVVMLDQRRQGGCYGVWERNEQGKETEREAQTAQEVSALQKT